MKHLMLLPVLVLPAAADPAVIEDVTARPSGSGWTFSVTLRHGDTGWDDYADGWRVLSPDGTVLGTRVLAHPHENEQPFTRSLGGVAIPEGLGEVVIEASTSPEGWGGERRVFPLP
ncbi:hypothetical protein CLV78_104255 [Aliiruegeria haliotis]|uniref:Uncharacterized protein n=1 Tax=Aliiruegeria haliotis TaxID=1280846 RepID=A0A2T0RRP8_9RHOB|nr:hypothetical protein [Aliiruegeria haliotis]PRY23763.1 hypothetical protein CLV78_104255 [Aliiruegeria haliotis]